MAKFVVLGGAGDMGSAVVNDLVNSSADEVLIADINEARGSALVSKYKDCERSRVSFVRVDVLDSSSLKSAFAGSDVVINTVGPFYKFEKGIISAALGASIDYVDICDDHDATRAVFEEKGKIDGGKSRILVGMGWTPGITNVLARSAYLELENVTDIDIAWSGSAADAAGIAVISHVFHVVTGDVPVFLDGRIENIPARQMRKEIEFPDPVGKLETYVVGHPEPLTVPLFLKGLKNVILRGALTPVWQNHLVSQFADVGLTEDKQIRVGNASVSARDFLSSFVHETMDQFKAGGAEVSGFYVEARGKRNGSNAVIRYSGADRMFKLTGWSASIGAQYLAANRNHKPGLYAPEGIIDPGFFIKELTSRGIRIHKSVTVEES